MGGRYPDQRRRWCRLAGAQGRHQLTVVGTFKRRPGNIFDPHAGHAIAFEFKKFSGSVGDIDEPVTVVRPPVIDADDQRFAVAKVGHARITRHREGRMGRSQRSHVEHFAIGGEPAMEIIAIPGGHALLAITGVLFRNVNPTPDGIRLAYAVGATARAPTSMRSAIVRPDAAHPSIKQKDIATRTRRKWEEYTRMMNRWLLWHAVDLRTRWI